MIQTFFIILVLFLFLNKLLNKWGIYEWLSSFGTRSKYKFIWEITNCKFCLAFHCIVLITIGYSGIMGFETHHLIAPFVVMGLLTLID